jgi:diguanylate cyclase
MAGLLDNKVCLQRFGMRALATHFRALVSVGSEQTQDTVLQRKIVLLNGSTLMAIAGCIMSALAYIPLDVFDLTLSGVMLLVYAVLILCVCALNRAGQFLLARVYFFVLTDVMILCIVVFSMGAVVFTHGMFLLLAITSFTFFRLVEWRYSVALAVLNVGFYLFFEIQGWPAQATVLAMAPSVLHLIRLFHISTDIVLLMCTMLLTERMMERYVQQLDRLGRTDVLTGLPNRRWFLSQLSRELSTVQRMGHNIAVALIDVDHFKRINDEHGHLAGDEALKHVALQLQAHTRAGDFVARLGGEEFMVLMHVNSPAEAEAGAERVRAGVEAVPFESPSGARRITVSIGVALYDGGAMPNRLLRAADLAMYRAKSEGRNLVVCTVEAQNMVTVPSALVHA